MKVCFDSNVVIDILAKSKDFLYSYSSYDVALVRGYEVYLPMFTTSDIAYILHRSYLSALDTRRALEGLFTLFELLDGHPLDCKQAFQSEMSDYEDALIAFAAERNGIDFIITRNKRDFAHSPVPALTPQEFVELHKPTTIDYALMG
jgi:predicted nucleic acid-binding protein